MLREITIMINNIINGPENPDTNKLIDILMKLVMVNLQLKSDLGINIQNILSKIPR